MSFNTKVAMVESGNLGMGAKNPRSSATGIYQFTRPTWVGLMNNYPELGLTLDGMQNSAKQQELAMEALKGENAPALQKVLGRTPTDAELYGAHHFGAPVYTSMLKADPTTPLEAITGPDVIAANPQFRGKTVGDVQAWLQGKMGDVMAGQDPSYSPVVRDIAAPKTVQMAQAPVMSDAQPQVPDGVLAQAMAQPQAPQVPQEEPSGFQRFMADNSDALLRFGAGMLAGKDMREGMALGAQGWADGKANQRKNDLTEKKLNRDEMLKLIELGVPPGDAQAVVAGTKSLSELDPNVVSQLGGKQQQGELFYSPDNTPYREIFSPRGGSVGFLNMTTGKVEKTLPGQAVRATDAGLRYLQKSGAEAQDNAMDAAIGAREKVASYGTLESALQGVQTGGDIVSTMGRFLAQKSGLNIAGNDPAAIDLANREFAKMELDAAQAMKGQGQITENEREILRRSVPNMRTNPEAMKAVMAVLKAQEQKKIDLYDAWESATPEQRAKGFKSFQYSWGKQNPAPSVSGGPGNWSTTTGGVKFRVAPN